MADTKLFQDKEGLPLKFFIAKDIPDDIHASVSAIIEAHGGSVESKVPRRGYILIQNGPEAQRLRSCWTDRERPQRYFVPYSFPEACQSIKKLIPQVLLRDGQPMKILIHRSITNERAREALAALIEQAGGDPHASEQDAFVVLAEPTSDSWKRLDKLFRDEPHRHLESWLWVKKCIHRGTAFFTPVVYKNPGGRPSGGVRVEFTEADDYHLAEWIAEKIPDNQRGGRVGKILYQDLCTMGGHPGYDWVARHPWQSWRERYKKNPDKFNKMIDQIIESGIPTQPGASGQLHYARLEKNGRKSRQIMSISATGDGGGDDKDEDSEFKMEDEITETLQQPIRKRGRPPKEGEDSASQASPHKRQRNAHSAEDGTQSSQWGIRVGTDVPPAWSKQRGESSADDPRLVVIARRHGFVIEDVKKYHVKSGSYEATDKKFERCRALLDAEMDTESNGEDVAGEEDGGEDGAEGTEENGEEYSKEDAEDDAEVDEGVYAEEDEATDAEDDGMKSVEDNETAEDIDV